MRRPPGEVRDAIIQYLENKKGDASLAEIYQSVSESLGEVAKTSVRSYLQLNTPRTFTRTGNGRYKINKQ